MTLNLKLMDLQNLQINNYIKDYLDQAILDPNAAESADPIDPILQPVGLSSQLLQQLGKEIHDLLTEHGINPTITKHHSNKEHSTINTYVSKIEFNQENSCFEYTLSPKLQPHNPSTIPYINQVKNKTFKIKIMNQNSTFAQTNQEFIDRLDSLSSCIESLYADKIAKLPNYSKLKNFVLKNLQNLNVNDPQEFELGKLYLQFFTNNCAEMIDAITPIAQTNSFGLTIPLFKKSIKKIF